jgi:cupin 2 domain-containing protein
MPPEIRNILTSLPPALPDEAFDTIIESPSVRIERIISCGQTTPEGQWLDQEHEEWVLLLAGAALLSFEGDPQTRGMASGDHLLIPAGCRHRVDWTDPDRETVWLAVHFPAGGAP